MVPGGPGNPGMARAARVFVGGDIVAPGGGSGSRGRIFGFDGQGQAALSFSSSPCAPQYFSLAAHGNVIYAASPYATRVERFTREGVYLGALGGDASPLRAASRIETDSRGSIYHLGLSTDTVGTSVRRISPDGSISQTFTQWPFVSSLVDADRHGNVYIYGTDERRTTGIFKYDSAGNLLGVFTQLQNTAYDMAIDEAAEVLYVTSTRSLDPNIVAYDISGPTPVFLRSIATSIPTVSGIAVDPANGHLLLTQDDAFRAWEIATDGAVIRRFRANTDEGSFFHFDVVALPVPEPAGIALAAMAMIAPYLTARSALRALACHVTTPSLRSGST